MVVRADQTTVVLTIQTLVVQPRGMFVYQGSHTTWQQEHPLVETVTRCEGRPQQREHFGVQEATQVGNQTATQSGHRHPRGNEGRLIRASKHPELGSRGPRAESISFLHEHVDRNPLRGR